MNNQDFIAWLFINAGVFAAGFGFAPLFLSLPWLALSIWLIAVALVWLGYEISQATHDEEDL